MKRLLTMTVLLGATLFAAAGCDDYTTGFGGFFGPSYGYYDDTPYYEEETIVVEDTWYDDWGWDFGGYFWP